VNLKGACLSRGNDPYQGYDGYLLLNASFEQDNIQGISVAIAGANDDQPADGTHPLTGVWQVTLGVNDSTKSSDLSFLVADATVGGETGSFLDALASSIGDMSKLRPGHPVGESCGGF
jgi:hypothetical protein